MTDGPGSPMHYSAAKVARRVGFVALAALALSPWASPALALGAGAAFALTVGNPFPARSARASRTLLQACVVGLGFGMPLAAVLKAGAAGVGYTVAGIALALSLGLLLGRWLRVERQTSWLITAGTSICGGSAIAAVGPAIGAGPDAMSVSLATVFVLNGVALYLFPAIGRALHLGQGQFAVWAAVAIHDTSSVVGAASQYGARALAGATVLKLARALWIVPLTLAASAWSRRRDAAEAAEAAEAAQSVVSAGRGIGSGKPASPEARPRVKLPWFIGLFVVAALARTLLPVAATPALDGLAHAARTGLVLTLFLIGAGLTRSTLRSVGARPLVQGLVLWIAVAGITLAAVCRWVPA
ncbi:MAG: hypothetical protein JWM27_944 [Gemmatimonadetes bacterium]|nr:hypothetical protein [Gemmatimonadota bacterium]